MSILSNGQIVMKIVNWSCADTGLICRAKHSSAMLSAEFHSVFALVLISVMFSCKIVTFPILAKFGQDGKHFLVS